MSEDLAKGVADDSKSSFETLKRVQMYLKRMVEVGGSDLHLKANAMIRARVQGEILPISGDIFSRKDSITFAKELLLGRFREFVENKELDLLYSFDDRNRFRVNIFFQVDGVSAVFRLIPVKILTIDELSLPAVIHQFTQLERGLVLVTGVTGSGKSTTLAAIIDEINTLKRKHIITIEDPIEFVHKDKKSMVTQRRIGQDTKSFSTALRAALREDPDIILIGEMRDRETIDIALHAADTGHLVFSTLHTLDAKETINRIISVFPREEQNRVRLTLASVLKGVISQRLIPTIENKRIAALEVLVRTPRTEQLIKENRDDEIVDTMSEGQELYGSQTFDQAIFDLYTAGKITQEKAFEFATSPSDLKLRMSGLNSKKRSSSSAEEEDVAKEYESDEIFGLKE